MASFYWYDLETTGIDPKWDRIVQFAGLRTDENLQPIGDELCFYVQLAQDVLPNPDASLVTGITPDLLAREGVTEWSAIQKINQTFAQPGTCTAGYNSLRFDDEFVRYTLYRNFGDPYAREWQQGNSRWDLIDLARATGALRREGINWPVDDKGMPVYKLERLTAANGIDHGNAHDALSDVRATVAMAQLIRKRQPRLFDFYRDNSSKKAVRRQLEPFTEKVSLHVSGMYSRAKYSCAPVVALCQHPQNSNSIIVADLTQDITPLIELGAQELRANLFGKNSSQRPGLKEIRINRCPFVAPIETLTEENAQRMEIDRGDLDVKLAALRAAKIHKKISSIFGDRDFPETLDIDAGLYDGFLSADDKARAESLQLHLQQNQWADMDFSDPKLVELAGRLKARSFAELMDGPEQEHWHEFVRNKLNAQDVPWLTLAKLGNRIDQLRETATVEQQVLLSALASYADNHVAAQPAATPVA